MELLFLSGFLGVVSLGLYERGAMILGAAFICIGMFFAAVGLLVPGGSFLVLIGLLLCCGGAAEFLAATDREGSARHRVRPPRSIVVAELVGVAGYAATFWLILGLVQLAAWISYMGPGRY